ncbi:MAG TPA: hypothetical protein VLS25_12935 [Dehalococcoidia bacterium]|nr:hypothetical protein [Dehalococcoidia bacterium]
MPTSPEVLGALLLAAGVVIVAGVVLLLSGGGGGSDGAASSATGTARPAFSPSNEDEAAIAALAEKSIEALPRNQWPALYDEFTAAFQARCPRDQFIQAGIDAAQEQGTNLAKLGYVRLEQVSIEGDQATATVIGEVKGGPEYTIYAAFARENGAWKLSAAQDTAGCQAFTRP